ncbi:cyclopropane-fatty-acyl-phospholipid synthase family protein [Brevundimonas sp.]|uniref:cyclopropane-fatty-acyl-phospholipid synthase family protein n=1 Tax=Brevundimonas sp. TaxID=1871086 RepID=UPI002D4C95DE|nr:cyclopropane-fatty-acyl-phospholipid synthase family protein [Brevundimonas sp.]HYC73991.1 cyclopropane-fatty-acyl-phospholipid synthase family protein [Brevundimonas sp.]
MSSQASIAFDRPDEPRVRSRPSNPLDAITRLAFGRLLKRLIRIGSLTVVLPSGEALHGGDGTSEPVRIRLRDNRTAWRVALYPGLKFGEAWMDGDVTLEQGSLWNLLDLIARNLSLRPPLRRGRLARLWRRIEQANDRAKARRNVAHHYDLSLDLYRRFLDSDLQYSCAYFEHAGMSLEEAQVAKKRHLAAKLLLEPGQTVLDIGCGWGGLGLTLAEDAGARVTGITLSDEQLAIARERAQTRGLADRVEFRKQDYRDVGGTFDRIVSVGMFEHVGVPNYQAYFDAVARLLKDDGVAVLHAIGQKHVSVRNQPWIGKYIFPGGYTPALSEILPAIERAGLWVTDIEILRLHYAETLKAWRERFEANRAEIAALYDERFCRMWEFYLCLSEVAFRHRGCMVFQIQLSKRVDAVPLTRDYIHDAEADAAG